MYYTYILLSEKFDKYYIGFTHDLNGRLIAHNHPKNKGYTKRYQPWKLAYSRSFERREDAMAYESYLKSLKSRIVLEELIEKNSTCSLGSYPDEIGT